MIGSYCVVTTDKRGVFAGVLAEREDGKAVLTEARNCIYWSKETRGFLGLAATGPMDGSRIGPPAPKTELVGVTSVTICTDEARARWEK